MAGWSSNAQPYQPHQLGLINPLRFFTSRLCGALGEMNGISREEMRYVVHLNGSLAGRVGQNLIEVPSVIWIKRAEIGGLDC